MSSDSGLSSNIFTSVTGLNLVSAPTQSAPTQLLAFTASPAVQTYLLGAATANRVITLPAVAVCAGVSWTFILNAAATHTWTITPATSVIYGTIFQGATGTPVVTNKQAAASIVSTATGVIGDRINIFSDGVNFYVNGFSGAAAGMS